jgi:polysaccharide export outer membrane protein
MFYSMGLIHFKFFKGGAAVLLVLFSFVFLQSCGTKKDLLYFQDGRDQAVIADIKISEQKIVSNDILSIKIYSLDAESARVYNIELLEQVAGGQMQLELIRLKGYLVNDQGTIVMPILGTILVGNKTPQELEFFLTTKLIEEGHLKQPTVTVRIINAKVTVLGEVRSPGTFTFLEKNITLPQALGLAGDLTINGSRKDVLLIRQEGETKIIHQLDLTSTAWMETDLYYVKQNDVIVVNPNNARIKSAGLIGNAGTLISVVSLLLTVFILTKN